MTNRKEKDYYYMYRCLEIARQGQPYALPNPMVGAVIVQNEKIIGEGFHRAYGEAHAEVNAIDKVVNKSLLKDSTLYVNLEPCAHYGKTPPCANLIVSHKIGRVVIGQVDPNPLVSGKGIKILQQGGCEVTTGVLQQESRMLNRRFNTFQEKRRPFIILKWAQTMDGYIDIIRNSNSPAQPTWITGEAARLLVHKWRTREMAIMVGTETALKDNPRLNVREWVGNHPVRITLDLNKRLPKSLHLFDQSVPTIVFTYHDVPSLHNLTYIKIDKEKTVLSQVTKILFNMNITSLFVEGGQQLLNSFIGHNLWDEARVFTGEKYFIEGIAAPATGTNPESIVSLKSGKLSLYANNSAI